MLPRVRQKTIRRLPGAALAVLGCAGLTWAAFNQLSEGRALGRASSDTGAAAAFEVVGQLGGAVTALAVSGDHAFVAAGLRLLTVAIAPSERPRMVGGTAILPGDIEPGRDPEGAVEGIAVDGTHAYVTLGKGGLRVFDISDPATPREVGALGLPRFAGAVSVVGGRAYVVGREMSAPDDGSLQVVDIRDPKEPALLGRLDLGGDPTDVEVHGGFAYVAVGSGLQVVDVAAADAPRQAMSVQVPARALHGLGSRMVLVSDQSLSVLDASNPGDPTVVGSLTIPGPIDWMIDVALVGGLAYVASANFGLRVFDVSRPSGPREVGQTPPGEFKGQCVAMSGGHVLVGGRTGLSIVDVGDTSSPRRVGSFDVPTLDMSWGPRGRPLAIEGGFAYVLEPGGLSPVGWAMTVIDIRRPEAPIQVATHHAEEGHTPSPLDVAVAARTAYVANENQVDILDLGDPTAPRLVGTLGVGAKLICVTDSLAYVFDGGALRVYDVSEPSVPRPLGYVVLLHSVVVDMVVMDGYAYLACGLEGLRIVDVRDPSAPRSVAILTTPGAVSGVAVAGGVALLAEGGQGLHIVDVRDPAAPREVGVHPGYARRVATDGKTAYVTSYGIVKAIDVRDPVAPREIDTFLPPGASAEILDVVLGDGVASILTDRMGLLVARFPTIPGSEATATPVPGGRLVLIGQVGDGTAAKSVHVVGDTAYVADGGLAVYGVSDPSSPSLLGRLEMPDGAVGVFAAAGFAYVVDRTGVRIVDVATPGRPMQRVGIPSRHPDVGSWAVAVAGHDAFVADGQGGLRVFDVTDPRRPRATGELRSVQARALSVADGHAYVADWPGALTVVDVAPPDAPTVTAKWWTLPGNVEDVNVADAHAYVATGGMLVVLDVSDADAPCEVARLSLGAALTAVHAADGVAYVTAGHGILYMVDVSTPSAPRRMGAYATSGEALDVTVSGDHAYVAGAAGLLVFRIERAAAPTPTTWLPRPVAASLFLPALSGR